MIESHNHAARDLNTHMLNSSDALQHASRVGPDILVFFRLLKCGLIGSFDADEDGLNISIGHEVHQFVIFRKIERRFCKKCKGVAVVLLILNDVSEHALDSLFIPDKVVIDNEHLVHVHPTQALQFREDLRARLKPRKPPKGDDNVTKFAGKGTSSGDLKTRVEVFIHF